MFTDTLCLAKYHTITYHTQAERSTAALALTHPWFTSNDDDVKVEKQCLDHYGPVVTQAKVDTPTPGTYVCFTLAA